MNCNKSNSVPSVFATSPVGDVVIPSRTCGGQQPQSLDSADKCSFDSAKSLKDKVLAYLQQRYVVTGFTNTGIMGLHVQSTAHFHYGACVPSTLNRSKARLEAERCCLMNP